MARRLVQTRAARPSSSPATRRWTNFFPRSKKLRRLEIRARAAKNLGDRRQNGGQKIYLIDKPTRRSQPSSPRTFPKRAGSRKTWRSNRF
jgi:hypothetical protein